jgi:type IV secretory pathway TraG/TraD family ATPase VirD4
MFSDILNLLTFACLMVAAFFLLKAALFLIKKVSITLYNFICWLFDVLLEVIYWLSIAFLIFIGFHYINSGLNGVDVSGNFTTATDYIKANADASASLVAFLIFYWLRKRRQHKREWINRVRQLFVPLKLLYLPENKRFVRKVSALREIFIKFGEAKTYYVLGSVVLKEGEPEHYLGYKTDKHLLSVAPTRTGKGRGLILPNLLNLPDHSVFVIDPKGENALVSARYRRSEGHEILIFNPYKIYADEFEARGFTQFQSFNPLANLNPTSPNFTDDVTIIAEALIYDTGGDSHWVEAARGLIVFLITYLVTQPDEQPTLRRLHSILSGGYPILKTRILEKAQNNPAVYENVGRYWTENNEVQGILATAETQTRIFKSDVICSALEGGAFNFERMKHNKISVYLILPSERLITQARYLRMVLLVAMSQFMRSEKGKHQVLMLLDEFANLGALNIIENGYGLIAGHGVTLWSFVQNLTQLKNLYPKNWPVFVANSGVVTVANVNDVETAEYFCKRAGKKLISRNSESWKAPLFRKVPLLNSAALFGTADDMRISQSQTMEDALPEGEFFQADPNSIFLFAEGRSEPIKGQKLYYDLQKPFNQRADKNPMHTGT